MRRYALNYEGVLITIRILICCLIIYLLWRTGDKWNILMRGDSIVVVRQVYLLGS